ncbi:hypothetical protein V2H45_15510 [Tumidithrix elongata RA019]|uniref:Uncharacterized protein n=1 Tax=Tumidithrix elongata BACA0141 TaxID=2716417 RepID=A0AAW9PTS1_9CYAN|nr:hypothetical protein [Tumidithrix elongata RA019]
MSQSEQELEQNLIQRLTGLVYEPFTIRNAAELTANLKTQLEKHNQAKLNKYGKTQLSDADGAAPLPILCR